MNIAVMCPGCSMKIKSLELIGGNYPADVVVLVCSKCAAILALNDDGGVMRLALEEFFELSDETQEAVVEAWHTVRMRLVAEQAV
jgi:hypothetical protein